MKKFLIVLILLCVIFLVAYGIFAAMQMKNNGSTMGGNGTQQGQVENSDGTEVPTPEMRLMSIDDAAKQIKDTYKDDQNFQQCVGDFVESCLSNVINARIAESGDLSLCDDFITEQARTGCKSTQTMRIAREKKDKSICSSLGENYRQSCEREAVVALAIEKKSIDPCGELEENMQQSCQTTVATQLAADTGDAAWCDKIPGEELEKEFCTSEVKFRQEEEARIAEEEKRIAEEQAAFEAENAKLQAEQEKEQAAAQAAAEAETAKAQAEAEAATKAAAEAEAVEEETVEPTPEPEPTEEEVQ